MSVNADYTVVCFWDPTCGHCREEVPGLILYIMPNGKRRSKNIRGLTETKKTKMDGIH